MLQTKPFYKNRIIFFSVLFLICIGFKSNATLQNGESVFTMDSVHEIRLYFTQSHYWDTLLSNYESTHDSIPLDKGFLMANVRIDGKNLDSIGVKLKSNLSYTIPSDKKPFKLDFNEFVKGKSFDGLSSLNLSNEFPDPSMLRNTVAYKIFRDLGIRAPRTSFAKVYVNDIYKGLYVIIEQVDKVFLTRHFKYGRGELIKPIGAYLFWFEDDTLSFRKYYEIKVNNSTNAYSRLISFTQKINTTPANIFYDSLKSVLDFDSYISVFAADIVFNNWDSYFYGQNYYLYRDSAEEKYYYLPWDYNISLNNYDIGGADYSILPGGENDDIFELPLPHKIIDNKKLRKKYLDEIFRINQYISNDSLEKFILTMHNLISSALVDDTGKVMTMDQFDKSLLSRVSISEIDFEGLLSFIRYRKLQIMNMHKEAVLLENNVIEK